MNHWQLHQIMDTILWLRSYTHLIRAVIQTKHGVFVRRYVMMQTAKQLDAFLFLLTMDGKKNNKK